MFKIAIIGPESSGKSTLTEYISNEFSALSVDEYAREYMLNIDNPLTYSIKDLIHIANIQYSKYQDAINSDVRLVVCDTEMLTIKIWAEDKFGYCPKGINSLFQEQKYDLYLLCKPDIEWTYDILREDKDRRELLFNVYKDYCDNRNLKYTVVEGIRESRYEIIRNIFSQLNY